MREIVLHEDYANAEEYLNDNNRVRIIIYIGPDYVDEVTPEYKAEVTENVYTMIPAKNVYEILFKEDKV